MRIRPIFIGLLITLLLSTSVQSHHVPMTFPTSNHMPSSDSCLPDWKQDSNSLLVSEDQEDRETMIVQANEAIRTRFVENQGQLKQDSISYYGSIIGGFIGFCKGSVQLWMQCSARPVILVFVDAEDVKPEGGGKYCSQSNFFLGARGSFTNINEFETVIYQNLWPFIDLIYRATTDGPKYEFHVNPGGDPNNIRIQYKGQDSLKLTTTSLIIQTGNESVVDDGLCALQGRDVVPVTFAQYESDIVGFSIGEYDKGKTLVIDPLLYSTYIGGGEQDVCRSVAVDSFGNAYVIGSTSSIDFPRMHAYDTSLGGSLDCFIVKLAANGSTLLYSTYIGGSASDSGSSIAVDSTGNIYVTGETYSEDFPVVSAYANASSGDHDLFVAKISADGSSLIYSTYIGGSSSDLEPHLALDEFGCVYVTAHTESTDFPIVNPYDSDFNGEYDAVVFQLNSTGEALLYSTYLGGGGTEFQEAITLDEGGRVYIAGSTDSSNFSVVNPIDSALDGGRDGYLSIFDVNASLNTTETLLYSTYIGGSDYDWINAIVVDTRGLVYLAGGTLSPDLPVTISYDETYNGNGDCFVIQLNITDNTIPYCTYIGGADDDERGEALAVGPSGTVFLVGHTRSSDFPTAGAQISRKYGNTVDIFVLRLDPSGTELLYSSFIGGSEDDWPHSMVLGDSGSVYVTGYTLSWNFPTINGRFLDHRGGAYDGFLFKMPDLTDSDGDGLSDLDEDQLGTDKYDEDSDDDLLLDGYEVSIGTDPLSQDSDLDTLDDYQEVIVLGTDPLSPDSESDGMPDAWEVNYGLNPLTNDSLSDLDEDNLLNLDEFLVGTDPTNSDSDQDMMPDGWEVENELNPLDPDDAQADVDNDALTNLQEYELGTDPLNRDSDSDNIPDGWEVVNGFDPLNNMVPLAELFLYNLGLVIVIGVGVVVSGFIYFGYGRYLKTIEERRESKLERESMEALDDLVSSDNDNSG